VYSENRIGDNMGYFRDFLDDLASEDEEQLIAVDYVYNRFSEIESTADAREVIELIVNKNPRIEYNEIVLDKNYELVRKYVKMYLFRQRSLKEKKENSLSTKISKKAKQIANSKIVFKTKDGRKYKWPVKYAVIAVSSVGMTIGLLVGGIRIGNNIKIQKEDEEISAYLAELANPGSDNPLANGDTIIDQNSVYKSRGEIVYYDVKNIAQDILDVSLQAPELFDLCIYDVYFNMEKDRLYYMDRVITILKEKMAKDERYKDLLPKVEQCNMFLDYLIYNGFIEPDADLYYVMEIYKNVGNILKLSANNQKIIVKAMQEYKEKRNELHQDYKEHIKGR
jgi:hypothetical protein